MKLTNLKYLPNILTFSNMAIGIVVICSMIHCHSISDIRLAIYLIYLAVVFDVFDGHIARYLNAVSEVGKQLDSFADFITFGVAPITIFVSSLRSISWIIAIALLVYPLAGGLRLVRYNLQKSCEYFIGLPITAAGFIMVTALLINSYISSEMSMGFIVFYTLLTLALSITMISRFHIKRILLN